MKVGSDVGWEGMEMLWVGVSCDFFSEYLHCCYYLCHSAQCGNYISSILNQNC